MLNERGIDDSRRQELQPLGCPLIARIIVRMITIIVTIVTTRVIMITTTATNKNMKTPKNLEQRGKLSCYMHICGSSGGGDGDGTACVGRSTTHSQYPDVHMRVAYHRDSNNQSKISC